MVATREERKAWVEFMAASLPEHVGANFVEEAALVADLALDQYRKRFPAAKPAFEDTA